MGLSITIDESDLRHAERVLRGIKNGFPKAISRSINSGLTAGRTEAAQLIRKRYALKAGTIKEAMTLNKASPSTPEGSIETKGPMLPVESFKTQVREKKSTGGIARTNQYVYVSVVRGKRKLIQGAFMPPSGRVFERRQPQRIPIFRVMTIGIPFMIGSNNIQPKVEARMVQAYNTALRYNVNFYLNKG